MPSREKVKRRREVLAVEKQAAELEDELRAGGRERDKAQLTEDDELVAQESVFQHQFGLLQIRSIATLSTRV